MSNSASRKMEADYGFGDFSKTAMENERGKWVLDKSLPNKILPKLLDEAYLGRIRKCCCSDSEVTVPAYKKTITSKF